MLIRSRKAVKNDSLRRSNEHTVDERVLKMVVATSVAFGACFLVPLATLFTRTKDDDRIYTFGEL